ncbi:MAG TPA: alanine racemase [Acidimicrobiales bacterium]|nr:alanine racemase [Acidimicrobiales bacterium]
MDPLPLGALAELLGGTPAGPFDPDLTAEHATIHSERIHRGSAFFALSGWRTDGHRFVDDALRNGATVAVVARGRASPSVGALVEVDDPLAALQRLAGWWRTRISGRVVAVVGSNGKTVTKDAIVHFAGYGMTVYGSPGSYNSQIGVPLAVLDCPPDCDLAVIEAAVSQPGEMARLQALLRPNHVVLTNLGARWASRFADRRAQAAELATMAADLGPEGWLLVGRDAPELQAAGAPGEGRRLVTGASAGLPRFSAPQPHPDGLAVRVDVPGGDAATVAVRAPSEEILTDVETALTAAWLTGVAGSALLDAAREYTPTSTRMEIWKAPGGVTVVRDVVTPDPVATRSALRAARRLCGPGHRCLVVLAEPLEHPTPASAAAFAGALAAEGADAVHGLDIASHREVAVAGEVPITLAAGPVELRERLLADAGPGDVVLVQSAPGAVIGDLAVALVESMAPTRLYLDLAAIEDNVTTFRRLVGPSVRIMGMVKALAYGTDAPSISASLQAAGVDALGVSAADEGIALRRAGISVPVLVMLGTAAELGKMLRHRLTPLVYAPDVLDAVLAEAAGRPASAPPIAVHLEVDSGMHRTGFVPDRAADALGRLTRAGVRVTGLMTHLASADDPAEDDATTEQLRRFRSVCAAADELGLEGIVRHAAATAATIRRPDAHFDMVRIGLGLYGVYPAPGLADAVKLQPAVGLVSRVVEVVEVPGGERVGYGGTFTAPAGGARVGVVPVGYHDGVPRSASNRGTVMVAGVRCPLIGRVSMDSMAVDLTGCPEAGAGSDVLVYGKHHDWSLPVEELAEASETIAHEVMARVGSRVQRIFTRH